MTCSKQELLHRLQSARQLPTLPAVLMPLLKYLERPFDSQDMHQIVNLISQDESLAARCLQIANSPLYGSAREIDSVQAAVVTLGLERIHQIAISCTVLKLLPSRGDLSPSSFWAHSLGCALVAHEFAGRIGFPDGAKAYAAGLLHDLGIVALLATVPADFIHALGLARSKGIALHEAEQAILGVDHGQAGAMVAQHWQLPPALCEAIRFHHDPEQASANPLLVALVAFSDQLCRLSGIGYGYTETRQTVFSEEPAYFSLANHYKALRHFDLARFTFEIEDMLDEVRLVVSSIYGGTVSAGRS